MLCETRTNWGIQDMLGSTGTHWGDQDKLGAPGHARGDRDTLETLVRERNRGQAPQMLAVDWGGLPSQSSTPRGTGGGSAGSPTPFWGARGSVPAAPFPSAVLPPFLSLSCNLSFCCEQEKPGLP